jgi:hypothetical protein
LSRRTLNLALQGGGALGAFTWGVLDRLLEEENLGFEGVSGASAGAMNALALAQGLAENGREGARQKLEALWRAVAAASFPMQAALGNSKGSSRSGLGSSGLSPYAPSTGKYNHWALGEHEGVSFMLADNETDLQTARLHIWHTARLLDQRERCKFRIQPSQSGLLRGSLEGCRSLRSNSRRSGRDARNHRSPHLCGHARFSHLRWPERGAPP